MYEEYARLSEAYYTGNSPAAILGSVQTGFCILLFDGRKTEVKNVMSQLQKGRFIYWRANQVKLQEWHRVIIEDTHTAAIARMFCDGKMVRPLTVAELADARNEIAIPWLPPIRGFAERHARNKKIEGAIHDLRSASTKLLWAGEKEMSNSINLRIASAQNLIAPVT